MKKDNVSILKQMFQEEKKMLLQQALILIKRIGWKKHLISRKI
jgi:hypothetical protein